MPSDKPLAALMESSRVRLTSESGEKGLLGVKVRVAASSQSKLPARPVNAASTEACSTGWLKYKVIAPCRGSSDPGNGSLSIRSGGKGCGVGVGVAGGGRVLTTAARWVGVGVAAVSLNPGSAQARETVRSKRQISKKAVLFFWKNLCELRVVSCGLLRDGLKLRVDGGWL